MRYISLGVAAAACALSAPVFASTCSLSDVNPVALACAGGYAGNILDNSPTDVPLQQAALAALGFTWDGTHFADFPKLSPLGGATVIDFPGLLNGITYVGIHVGGSGGGQTTFYKFDAGTALDTFSINLARSSGAVLYSTEDPSPTPEPVSWAMMLGGFGAIGGFMRARRRESVRAA